MEDRYLITGHAFDIIAELDELHTRIIMTSAFGQENVADIKLSYIENGHTIMMQLGQALRDIFLYIGFRGMRYEISIIPYLLFLWYSSKDREFIQNIKISVSHYPKILRLQKHSLIRARHGVRK